MKFYFSRSARRHKIGKAHALAALANAQIYCMDTDPQGAPQFHWIADDDRGVQLHLIGKPALEDPNLMIIYHVMPTSLEEDL